MRERILSSREYCGFLIQHVEEEAFRGATPRNPTGWSKQRYWVIPDLDWDERTLREAKAFIDRRVDQESS